MRPTSIVIGALIAFAVSVVCLIPPGIHFVSGPIGPLIGGYVAGNRLRLGEDESMVVGLAMGVALGGTIFAVLQFLSIGPDLAWQASLPLSVVAALYVGVLGGLGAWFAGKRAVQEE